MSDYSKSHTITLDTLEQVTSIAELRMQLSREKEAHRETLDRLHRFIAQGVIIEATSNTTGMELSIKLRVGRAAVLQARDRTIIAATIGEQVSQEFAKALDEYWRKGKSENE